MDDPPLFVTPAFQSQVTRLDAPADYPCPIYERNSAAVNREIDTSGHSCRVPLPLATLSMEGRSL